jgi:hypothetical protein
MRRSRQGLLGPCYSFNRDEALTAALRNRKTGMRAAPFLVTNTLDQLVGTSHWRRGVVQQQVSTWVSFALESAGRGSKRFARRWRSRLMISWRVRSSVACYRTEPMRRKTLSVRPAAGPAAEPGFRDDRGTRGRPCPFNAEGLRGTCGFKKRPVCETFGKEAERKTRKIRLSRGRWDGQVKSQTREEKGSDF